MTRNDVVAMRAAHCVKCQNACKRPWLLRSMHGCLDFAGAAKSGVTVDRRSQTLNHFTPLSWGVLIL